MTTWRGGSISNINEMGAAGNIICFGPFESLERFLEIKTGRKYFDEEVYSEEYNIGWKTEDDEIVDEKNDIHRIQVPVSWFSKLIPASILNLRLDFPDCDFEIICEFGDDGKLSDWWKVRNYKTIPSIAELLTQGKLDGHETMCGWLRLGKSFPNHVHEELQFDLDPNVINRIKISQEIDIIDNKVDVSKSFFLSI